jgi:hypothetical protein
LAALFKLRASLSTERRDTNLHFATMPFRSTRRLGEETAILGRSFAASGGGETRENHKPNTTKVRTLFSQYGPLHAVCFTLMTMAKMISVRRKSPDELGPVAMRKGSDHGFNGRNR